MRNVKALIDFVVKNRVSFLTLVICNGPSPLTYPQNVHLFFWRALLECSFPCEICTHHFSSLLSLLWNVCITVCAWRGDRRQNWASSFFRWRLDRNLRFVHRNVRNIKIHFCMDNEAKQSIYCHIKKKK